MNFLGSFLSAIKPRTDDDPVDRLNYYYTTVLILIFSITISAKQYVGAPIQCWVPAQFTGAWEQYAENYCFVQNTYWLKMHSRIPDSHVERDDRQIGYYQWVPFILALQAIFFYVPVIFWRQFNWQSGIDVESIIKMAADTANVQAEAREKAVAVVARHVDDACDLQKNLRRDANVCVDFLRSGGKQAGFYVTGCYLVVKIMFLCNLVLQFAMLEWFLAPNDRLWGLNSLLDLLRGVEWEETGAFPRVTLCDFEVRVLGNIHRYTIQCVLMINMFNEKIFIFLWWWFVFVGVLTITSMVYWLISSLSSHARVSFVSKYLRVSDAVAPEDSYSVKGFVCRGLGADGVLVLRMVSAHAGDLITTDIVQLMWLAYRQRQRAPVGGAALLYGTVSDEGFKRHLVHSRSDSPLLVGEQQKHVPPPPAQQTAATMAMPPARSPPTSRAAAV